MGITYISLYCNEKFLSGLNFPTTHLIKFLSKPFEENPTTPLMRTDLSLAQLLFNWILVPFSKIFATANLTIAVDKKLSDFKDCQATVLDKAGCVGYHVISLKYSDKHNCEAECNEKQKDEIKIRKQALSAIDQRVNLLEYSKDQATEKHREASNNDYSHRNVCDDIIEIDLEDLVGRDVADRDLLLEECKILLEKILNENCWKNGEIKESPYYATEQLKVEKLKIVLRACSCLGLDFNSWCRVLKYLPKTFHNLPIDELYEIVHALTEKYGLLTAMTSIMDKPHDLDKISFFETSILLTSIFEQLNKAKYHRDVQAIMPLITQLSELSARLWNDLVAEKENQKMTKPLKLKLLEWVLVSFPNLQTQLIMQKDNLIQEQECKAYFTIISKFTPEEFYDNLELKEFTPLLRLFEYYLSSVFGFLDVSITGQALGVINSETDVGSIGALNECEGFLRRHCLADKKIWIHFGWHTI